jgi:hypothetical protein
MYPPIVRTPRSIRSLDRVHEPHPAVRCTEIQAVLGRDELALRVHDCKRAGHCGKIVNPNLTTSQPRLEKAAFKDVEPSRRAGLRVVGRAFAKVTADGAEDSGGATLVLEFCHDAAPTEQERVSDETKRAEIDVALAAGNEVGKSLV